MVSSNAKAREIRQSSARMNAATLDRAFVRRQFPAFAEPSLSGQAFFENAGGSYACGRVIERLGEYYRRLKVQPYYVFGASREAGEWMDLARARLGEYLGVTSEEVHFGPSTSQNTYVLAQAVRPLLAPGDEIIVTNQDHEANSGAWRRLAAAGMIIKEWRVDPRSGTLDPRGLEPLIGPRTRLLAFPHASNIVAHENPVAVICEQARAAGVTTVVDGVSWAPHGLPDVPSLNADVYLFSLYKTYGPHQGLMVVRRGLIDRLANEGHYFNAQNVLKRLVPAGPDHAQIAAASGIAEYFDALDAHHYPSAPPAGRAARVRSLLRSAETPLLGPLLEFLRGRPDVRLLGPTDPQVRAPTVAFVPQRLAPSEVGRRLAERGFMAGYGNFYAVRLLEALGIDPQRGTVRASFVHYTTASEVNGLIEALEAALTP
jgi:selenocysteine lyase/cysteine desulfurase